MAKAINSKIGTKDIHIFLASKGGIGKSFCAAMLAKYAMSIGKPMQVYDMDSSNQTLVAIKGLNAKSVKIGEGTEFRHQEFDKALETMMRGDGPHLMDVGASMFQPVWGHLISHDVLSHLDRFGSRIVLHFPITGGGEAADTFQSLVNVSEGTKSRRIVAWLNPYHGDLVYDGGKTFYELGVYERIKDKLIAVIELPKEDNALRADLAVFLRAKGNLLDVEKDEQLPFFSKHRIANFRKVVFSQIEPVWGAIVGEREQYAEA